MKKRKTQKRARARRNSDLVGYGVSLAWTAARKTKSKNQRTKRGVRKATKNLRTRR